MTAVNILDDINILPDISPRRKALLRKLVGDRIIDILWHLPYNINNRKRYYFLRDCIPGTFCTLILEVSFHVSSHALRKPAKVVCTDGQDKIELLYFNTSKHYLTRVAPSGTRIVVSGKIEFDEKQKIWQMIHPDHVGGIETLNHWIGIEPVYRLTAGILQPMIRTAVYKALSFLPRLPEWHDKETLEKFHWPSFAQALHLLHNPLSVQELNVLYPPRTRLILDEFLAQQIGLQYTRRQIIKIRSVPIKSRGKYVKRLVKSLPFELTKDQECVFSEIEADLARSVPMLRLIQGDVGSGKTIVAIMAMVKAVEAGFQAAILAPTEILARQHYSSIKNFLSNFDINIEVLTSREKGKVRQSVLNGLDNGNVQILVGTHAIIQESVRFKKLALVIIDEQHRFGVEQRLALSQKGQNPHILTMTATPIPRTLMMANYGEMDVSHIREKPKGRQEISTRIVSLKRLDEVVAGLRQFIDTGNKVYWVCPLIEESENFDFTAANKRFEHISGIYQKRVGLIHGKMRGQDKDIVMEQFIRGNLDIVVATTVIEVGVDVADATIMVIEHAERFGLSQLHQLRGRVGRSTKQSICIMLYGENISQTAQKRLEVIRESTDGFFIAEEDLKLRGGGEMLGTRQSGFPRYRFADFNCDDFKARRFQQELLAFANEKAKSILDEFPDLNNPKAQSFYLLLSLFEQQKAVKYRRTG